MFNLTRNVGLLLVSSVFVGEASADAATNFVLNKTNFFSNDPVILEVGAISIDSSDTLVPASNVFVIPAGMTLDGSSFLPAIDPSGVPNVIFGLGGGGFFGETIGFTRPAGSIGAGTWDIVEDTNQNNIFDLGDSVLRNAFTVNLNVNVPPIMSSAQIAQIKLNASSSRSQLESAKAFLDGSRFAAGAIGAGFENGIDAAIEYARDELVSQFLPCRSVAECALAYAQGLLPETPIEWGFRVIDDAVEDMAGHYAGIAADPPDPEFQQVTVLDPRIPVFAGGNDPFDLPATNVFRAQQDEAATAEAFLHAMERYQGADAEGNGDWALLHARQLREFALLLAENMTSSNNAYSEFVDALNADSRDLDSRVGAYQTFIENLQTNGYSAAQRQGLANLGLSEEDEEDLLAEITLLDLSSWSKAALVASLQALVTGNLSAISDLGGLATFLDGIIAQLVADPLVADNFPIVDAGGPYIGGEGSLLNLDASASAPGSGAASITNYAWDLDGDGQFDDATGATPSVPVNSKYSGIIGLKVTNDQDVMNVGFASLSVTDANPAPSLISFATPNVLPTVIVGNGQAFSINATDNGAFTVEWLLDGVVVANGGVFNYLPGLVDVGLHHLVARIDDGTSDGGVITQTWTIAVTEDDADGDGFTPIGGDCNDGNEFVNPDMPEVIGNGLDDDCDPVTEDVDQPPVAGFISFPLFAANGEPIEFLSRTSDPNGDITSHEWDFGDGSTSSATNPTHIFGQRGAFDVMLTITDSQGNSDIVVLVVEVLGEVSVEMASDPDRDQQDTLGRLSDDDVIGSMDISDDGKWIVFVSKATNLIANDVNGIRADIYVKNTETGDVVLINKHNDGTQGAVPPGTPSIFALSRAPDMTADGRYIAFMSTSKNLIGVDADADGVCDDCDLPFSASIYIHDRDSDENGVFDEPGGFTTRHIVGGQFPFGYLSDDANTLVFQTDNRTLEYVGSEEESLPGGNIFTTYVFTQDLTTNVRRLVSRTNDGTPGSGNLFATSGFGIQAQNPISADGTQVVFFGGHGDYVGEDANGDGTCDIGCIAFGNLGLYIFNDRDDSYTLVARNRLGDAGFGGGTGGVSVDMTPDGRFIAFVADDDGLIVDDQGQIVPNATPSASARRKVYLLDRDIDENGLFDEAGGFDVEYIGIRVGNSSNDPLENLASRGASVSHDGRLVLFQGTHTALIGPPEFPSLGTGQGPILRDRLANRNVVPFRDFDGSAPGLLTTMRMTPNGRHIIAMSIDGNLIGTDINGNGRCRAFPDGETDCDSNGEIDIFFVDRDADNDGLFGDADGCPNSLPNAQVDDEGCPLGFGISIMVSPQLPAVALGASAAFDVTVANDGDADLTNVLVSDPELPNCDTSIGGLLMGETFEYNCSQLSVTGAFAHTVTVNAETTAGEPVSASDSAAIAISTPSIAVSHTPDPKEIDEGLDYLLNVSVTNTGDTNLQNVTVDGNPTDPCDRVLGNLSPGESTSYSCLIENAVSNFTSTVNAIGTPSSGNDVTASDSLDVVVIPGEEEPLPPPTPVNVRVRAKSGKTNLVWTHNGSTSYNVYRSQGASPFALRGNTSSTYSVFVDNSLTNSIEYCYFVRALGGQGLESVDSATVCATPQARRRRGR